MMQHDTVGDMRDFLVLAIHLIVTLAKLLRPGGAKAVAAESLVLRQQLMISNRSRSRAPNLTSCDRFLLGLTTLFVREKRRNPKFGCVRIAQQISRAFGIDLDKDVVRRILIRHYRPESGGDDGLSWLTLIVQAKDSLWSVDLFRCESILLRSYWVMLVMDVFTRRIVGIGVERETIDGIAVCRMFNCAVSGQQLPRHISTDNDPLFRFYRWLANLRVLEIDEIKSVPRG